MAKIIVKVKGGMVEGVFADEGIGAEVFVADADCLGFADFTKGEKEKLEELLNETVDMRQLY